MVASGVFDYYNLALIIIKKNTHPRTEGDMETEEYYEQQKENLVTKSICDLVTPIISDKILSTQQKLSLCDVAKELLTGLRNKIEEEATPCLPNTGNNYQRYPGAHEDALKWLEKHWGKYLKFFGAEKNHLFQDQLWKLDEKLMSTITRNSKYRHILESKKLKVRDIIPRKSERITENILRITKDLPEEEVFRTCCAKVKRESTSQKFAK